jgi:hypothetical protein
MPLAAPVTRTVSPFTDRLSCLKSDMGALFANDALQDRQRVIDKA